MRVIERIETPATTAVSPGRAVRSCARAVTRAWHGMWWYLREVSGENGYQHYLEAYVRNHGCTHGAMTEREFWRDKTDRQDREPQARCC